MNVLLFSHTLEWWAHRTNKAPGHSAAAIGKGLGEEKWGEAVVWAGLSPLHHHHPSHLTGLTEPKQETAPKYRGEEGLPGNF